MADTIGGVAYLRGGRWLAVRGYGLVAGLGKNGARECPRPLRSYMLQEIRKRLEAGGVYGPDEVRISAKQLLESVDTAVVEVTGLIPPGACQGARFDVRLRAVPGSDAKSLAGGRLYTCSLHTYRFDTRGGVVHGRPVASAAGPVFQNPFVGGGPAATEANPREATVLGGGKNLHARRMELVLNTGSHRLARQIMNRINERYGGGRRIAEAVSPSRIHLRAPRTWRGREDHFYSLVMHLPLAREEAYLFERARSLIEMLKEPDPPAEDIALVLEAMGQPAVEAVQPHYADRNRIVRYYCARVGLRLRDDAAVEVLAREAADPYSPFREAAIRELGSAEDVALARLPLRGLVNDPDERIRILAYEGLSKHNDEKVDRYMLGGNGEFVLDVVATKAEPLIYATRTMEGRIAVFGADLRCKPPLFYMHPDKIVTISADVGQEQLTLVRRAPTGQVSEPLKISRRVVDLIRFLGGPAELDEQTGQVRGLGLLYGQVLGVIGSLCQSGAIPARLELQRAGVSELFGPVKRLIRPESEIQE